MGDKVVSAIKEGVLSIALIALMKVAHDWGQFSRSLKKAFPLLGDQMELDIETEDD